MKTHCRASCGFWWGFTRKGVIAIRKITNIIIHCSDSTFGDSKTIDEWHKEKGWREIGYHYVILNGVIAPGKYVKDKDGLIEAGREINNDTLMTENEVGAHALGYNRDSIGACMIGGVNGSKDYFSLPQYWSTIILVAYWASLIPSIRVSGHNETGVQKACPVIDMDLFRKRVSELLNGYLCYKFLEEDVRSRGI